MFGIGSIPFGRIWSRILGNHNIREHGSGNIGTSNAWRVNGMLVGLLTAVCDVGKGFTCFFMLDNMMLFGAWVVLGHMYAPWSGGKGVAPFFGVCLAVFHLYALIPMLIWGLLVCIKTKPTNASYIALLIMTIIASFYESQIFMLTILLSVSIVHKHLIANLIKRDI
ncbi:glycerol-3-phosphate acyltransferase [Candidatus Cytomitobacter primus]|nr:glycerol-3-phosphate acyltransferase [Candidatus Cytomitobacter primus]